jgi:hypothetical protein
MRRMVEGQSTAEITHAKLGGARRGMRRRIPPPARFSRHLPRAAGEEPLVRLALLAMTTPSCHREERSDEAIPIRVIPDERNLP